LWFLPAVFNVIILHTREEGSLVFAAFQCQKFASKILGAGHFF